MEFTYKLIKTLLLGALLISAMAPLSLAVADSPLTFKAVQAPIKFNAADVLDDMVPPEKKYDVFGVVDFINNKWIVIEDSQYYYSQNYRVRGVKAGNTVGLMLDHNERVTQAEKF
ncbi:MAG: hypothetical protein D3926_09965 [Desulfobacteraceae bacterium]|nr:MAG: hypothetical protein D3926_09965 [Desulfobacteraceae bacterium]